MLLSGIFPPITTPFYPDGEVYYKKIESNVERYSRTPVAGIVVLGSTGEAIFLSDQERRDVLKTALAAAAPSKVMVAGTGVESAHGTLQLTEYAADLGYDAVLVRTPHYYKKQMLPANLLAFYRTVADRSALPIILYNFPGATGYDMPAELVIELAGHPNIVAIKESSGNVDKVKQLVEGTRHGKRQATVTETFEAVTPRMLKAAAAESEKQSRDLVSVASLSGSAETTVVFFDVGSQHKRSIGISPELRLVPLFLHRPLVVSQKSQQKAFGLQADAIELSYGRFIQDGPSFVEPLRMD